MNLGDVFVVTLVPPCLFLHCIMVASFESRLNFENSYKTEVCLYLKSAPSFSHLPCKEPKVSV